MLRGARLATLALEGGANLEVDGLTIYGGQAPVKAAGITGFRMCHTACRGLAAPWTFRGSLKYRSIESRLFTTSGWGPSGSDGKSYEIAYCEFTDSVDGVFIGNIDTVVFHHNLVDNISDDGLFVTAATGYDGETPGGGHRIFQNRFSRCLTTFAFGVGHGRQKVVADGKRGQWGTKQLGKGLTICRNVFDFRRPVMYYWPTGPDAPQELSSLGRFAGDHGSPGWEPMLIYHNTLLAGDAPRYEYATDGFSRAVGHGSYRRVYNNIVCQLRELPGQWLPEGQADYAADGNLLWSVSDGPRTQTLPKPRYGKDYNLPPAEWAAHDKFADPRFVTFHADWRQPVDLRLREESPAVDAGVEIPLSVYRHGPAEDPLKGHDKGRPDMGAVPRGVEPWRVGCYGRLDVFGNPLSGSAAATVATKGVEFAWSLPIVPQNVLPVFGRKPAVVVTGYPAFEAPLVTFALRKRGVQVAEVDKAWLDPREYAKYAVVVIDGSFTRAGLKTTKFADDELPIVRTFLEEGGTLWLFRERQDVFGSDHGQRMLADLFGQQWADSSKKFAVLRPEHPWIAHLTEAGADLSWLEKGGSLLGFKRGEAILGLKSGKAFLGRLPVGKGQIIYVGLAPAASLPNGRVPPTVAEEQRFETQMRIISNIVADVYPNK